LQVKLSYRFIKAKKASSCNKANFISNEAIC
jgi:hypothetical protein